MSRSRATRPATARPVTGHAAGTEQLAVTLADIEAARRAIAGAVISTPFLPAPKLSELTGAQILVKYENLQATASFKDRGALVRLLALAPDERTRGVIAMSAGNHAQAVAYHARRFNIPATIVMPEATPFVKITATEALGARVVLAGETVAEARVRADSIGAAEGLTLIHPYDDRLVIAGQGTVALEMLEAEADLDCVLVPVGGGGLIAGVAVAFNALAPDIEILGVECDAYPSLHNALRGIAEPVAGGQTLAEGIAVKSPGQLTLPIARALVSDVLLVSEEAIEKAVAAFLSRQKTMAEGAGAAGLAAVMAAPERFAERRVGLILTGGNIDPRILASIAVRGLEREGRIVALRIWISDRPGQLGRIASLLGRGGANIIEVWHQRLFLDVPAQGATVDIQIEVKDPLHARKVEQLLSEDGFRYLRLETTGASRGVETVQP